MLLGTPNQLLAVVLHVILVVVVAVNLLNPAER